MQTSNFTKILVTTGVLSLFFFLPSHSALAIEYGGFGGKPAYPNPDNTRTQSIFIHTLEPGAAQDEGVLVVNNAAESKTLMIYSADSTPSTGGAFACKQLAEAKTDVGAWIALAQSEVTLAPGTNEVITFTIQVPQDASVGEHNGCILIQEKKELVEGQTGASLSVRTGIRVAVTIPGQIIRQLDIVGFTVTSGSGGFVLQPLVKNVGNVSIDADAQVVTSDILGLSHVTSGGQYPILRGDTSEWNFELKKPFWGGWYRSSFTVGYDENPEAGVGVQSGKSLTSLTGSSVWFFSLPTPAALAIEIVILLFIISGGLLIWRWLGHHRVGSRKAKPRAK